MAGAGLLVGEADLVDLDHRRTGLQGLEGDGDDGVPVAGRGRGPGEDEPAGPVDLPVGPLVEEVASVADHDDAEIAAHARIGLGPGLADRPRPHPGAELLGVEPGVVQRLGRGGDLAPHGHGELAGGVHFDSFPASRVVTKRSSEASWSLQKRR